MLFRSKLFGLKKLYFNGTITYIAAHNKPLSRSTNLTWYDARADNPDRSEYRFYYTHAISVFRPKVGDILLISQDINQNVVIVIINDINIKNNILSNINLFTSYDYVNGSSYYANLSSVPFLRSLI